MYFITYPVTPNMGLRESIDAMLNYVAYARHDFGYLPTALHQANNEGLSEFYGSILNTGDILTLAPVITDSALLADLVDTLVELCNGYPSFDDERVSEIETERLIDSLNEAELPDGIYAEEVAYALFELGAYIEHSEYGASFSEEDLNAAIEHVKKW